MEQEITAIIADALRKHNEISINGLGVFSVQHQKQDHLQTKNGQVLLVPPSDKVIFDAENGKKKK